MSQLFGEIQDVFHLHKLRLLRWGIKLKLALPIILCPLGKHVIPAPPIYYLSSFKLLEKQ